MFFGFKEGRPKFPPTFKVERHEKGFKYKVRAPLPQLRTRLLPPPLRGYCHSSSVAAGAPRR